MHQRVQDRSHRADHPPGASQVDAGSILRTPGTVANRNLEEKLWLHRSCQPIDKVELRHERQLGFAMECEGGCGL